MTEKRGPRDDAEIDRLVRSEIGQALEKYRAGDPEARLRRRLAAEGRAGTRTGRHLNWPRIAVPAIAGLMLVVAVRFAFVILRPISAPFPAAAGPIAAVLRELPPFSGAAPDPAAGPAGGTGTMLTGGAIASVLGAAVAGANVEAGPGPARADLRRIAPLTMKKRMEILFKDKVIERVLISWALKAKEA